MGREIIFGSSWVPRKNAPEGSLVYEHKLLTKSGSIIKLTQSTQIASRLICLHNVLITEDGFVYIGGLYFWHWIVLHSLSLICVVFLGTLGNFLGILLRILCPRSWCFHRRWKSATYHNKPQYTLFYTHIWSCNFIGLKEDVTSSVSAVIIHCCSLRVSLLDWCVSASNLAFSDASSSKAQVQAALVCIDLSSLVVMILTK